MDKQIYYTKLYDLYCNLLTDKQKDYFKLYYFENLTLEEIAEYKNITKSGVSKQIKTSEAILTHYESKLKLLEKFEKLEKTFGDNKIIFEKIQKIWEE